MTWCKTCGDYMLFPETHRCLPLFVVQENGGYDPVDVYAFDESAAAEKYCEQSDAGGGDYSIIRAGETTLKVTDPRTGAVSEWAISAESVPQYTAHRRQP